MDGVIPHPEYLPAEHGDTEVDFMDFLAETRLRMNNDPETKLRNAPKAQARGRARPGPRSRAQSRGHSQTTAPGSASRRPSQGRSVRHRGMTPPPPVDPPWAAEAWTPAPEQQGSTGSASSGAWQGYSAWSGSAWQGQPSQARPSSRSDGRWDRTDQPPQETSVGSSWGSWQPGTAYRPAPSQAPAPSTWADRPHAEQSRWNTWDSGDWHSSSRKGKRKGL